MKADKRYPDTITIPLFACGWVLMGFPISTRLANVLRLQKLRKLGELDGLTYDSILHSRNCGWATLKELRQLIGQVQAGGKPGKAASALPVCKTFSIPKYARQIHPSDLPISVRLAKALECSGVIRLADLREHTPHDFKRLANCGQGTRDELVRLVDRVAAGEFRPVVGAFSIAKVAAALRPVDEAMAALPKDWREILLFHLGGDPTGPPTLTQLAGRYPLTRSRIGQIVEAGVEEIRQAAGLKMGRFLEGLAAHCRTTVCPLSPELLAKWLMKSSKPVRYPPLVYVRLLSKLNPKIPVWLHGQDRGRMSERDQDISYATEAELYAEEKGLPLKAAWLRVGARMGGQRPDPNEFLEALKHSRALTVDFPIPNAGTVRLHRRSDSRHTNGSKVATTTKPDGNHCELTAVAAGSAGPRATAGATG